MQSPSGPIDPPGAALLRARLVAANPDRASAIDGALARAAACYDVKLTKLARDRLTSAADTHLNADELAALVAFYEGADRARLEAAARHMRTTSESLPPTERQWALQTVARPELVKFGLLVQQIGRTLGSTPALQAAIGQCRDTAFADLRASGLVE